MIEERKVTFTSAAPLRAWQLFRVSTCDDGFLLSSPMPHDPDPTPRPCGRQQQSATRIIRRTDETASRREGIVFFNVVAALGGVLFGNTLQALGHKLAPQKPE